MPGTVSLSETLVGWHEVQESLARLTGLEYAVYDVHGNPIGMVSGESPFCRAARRRESDTATCDDQCGRFIRSAPCRPGVRYYKCGNGQNVFALTVKSGGQDVVIAGGKTFSNRQEYEGAIKGLMEGTGRLSLTGKHRYRFVGRKRLKETVDLVQAAAGRHFDISHQKQKYQTRLSRLSALLENVSLLYHEGGTDGFVRGMLRNLSVLFDADAATLTTYGPGMGPHGETTVHEQGDIAGLIPAETLGLALARRHARSPEIYRTGKASDMDGLGLGGIAGAAVSVPFYRSGALEGVVCLVNPGFAPDEAPSLRAYIQQCAAILENKRLKGELRDKMKGLKELVDIGSKIGPMMDTADILRFIFDKSAEIIRAERGSLMLINEATDELVVKVSRGMSSELSASLRLKLGEGIAGGVVTTGTPLVVRDMETDARLSVRKRPRYTTRSFISLPLKAEGRVIGVLNLSDKENGEPFGEEDLEVLSSFASQAAVALERAIYYGKAEELRQSSIMDPVTGLLNQRYFSDRLFEEIDRSERYGRRFSLLVVRLDGLKGFGGRLGRRASDEAVVETARALRGMLRSNDIVSRYSEEGFAIALPETDNDSAALLAGRIQETVSCLGFAARDEGAAGRITVHLGLASYPEDGLALKDLFDKASALAG
ncbi:MAG: diguanylate cyclase [Nitrospirae bacterium]|nr:diguanylate cyclase [Nitrospirota bacterium]